MRLTAPHIQLRDIAPPCGAFQEAHFVCKWEWSYMGGFILAKRYSSPVSYRYTLVLCLVSWRKPVIMLVFWFCSFLSQNSICRMELHILSHRLHMVSVKKDHIDLFTHYVIKLALLQTNKRYNTTTELLGLNPIYKLSIS